MLVKLQTLCGSFGCRIADKHALRILGCRIAEKRFVGPSGAASRIKTKAGAVAIAKHNATKCRKRQLRGPRAQARDQEVSSMIVTTTGRSTDRREMQPASMRAGHDSEGHAQTDALRQGTHRDYKQAKGDLEHW